MKKIRLIESLNFFSPAGANLMSSVAEQKNNKCMHLDLNVLPLETQSHTDQTNHLKEDVLKTRSTHFDFISGGKQLNF